jgi:signal peptidase I
VSPPMTIWTAGILNVVPPAVADPLPLPGDEPVPLPGDEPVPLPMDVETPKVRRRRTPRILAALGRIAYRLVMTAATVFFLAIAALPLADHKALIVTSGSMEPLLSAGDAAIVHIVPLDALEPGDVITYQGYSSDGLTTHRIVKPVQLESGLHFQTQGDANPAPDPNLVPAGGVVGRYVAGAPGFGRVLLFLARPESQLLIVGFPALIILLNELRYLLAHRSALRPGRRTVRNAAAGLLVAGLASAGVWATTGALMTDVTSVGDNTLTTADTFPTA